MAGTGGGEREDEAFFLAVEALQTLFAGLDGAVDGEEGIVGVTGLAATIDGHPPPAVGGVVFEVLNAVAGVAGEYEELAAGALGADAVGPALVEGTGVAVEGFQIVFEEHLVVVVGARGVAIDGHVDVETGGAVGAAHLRPEGDGVDAAAAVAVGHAAALVDDGVFVEAGNLGQEDGAHDAAGLGVDAHAVDFVAVEDTNIKGVVALAELLAHDAHDAAADFVVFVLDGGIDPAGLFVKVEAAEVAGEAGDAAEDTALEVGLDEAGGERKIGTASQGVDGYALYV